MQDEEFSHADLYRRARRAHERRLRDAVQTVVEAAKPGRRLRGGDRAASSRPASAAIPYAPGGGVPRAREGEAGAARRRADPGRVSIADGVGGMHGVTHTIEEIRERGVPGFEVEVIGTDPNVDRRLSSVAEVEIPYYPGLRSACRASRRSSRRSPRALRRCSTSARPAPPA